MEANYFRALVLATILSSISVANATLIETDFMSSGDGLLTLDTETNLEWLDFSETLGQSFNSISGGFGNYVTTYGFRYATSAEVLTLIDNAGGDNPAGISNLLGTLGCTVNCATPNPGALSITNQGSMIIEYSWFLTSGTNSDVFVPGADVGFPDTGSLLVRVASIPEPTIIALFAAGLFGLGIANRRKL